MPTQKDLKRLVRARMRKTGEAYTAARAQITSKSKTASPTAPASSTGRVAPLFPAPAPAPDKPDYAAIAGMADEKVRRATGCDWAKWVYVLDRHKAYELPHRELAVLIKKKYRTPDWWTQTVAVGYERIKGKRVLGQRMDGLFHATRSRTFSVPVEELFDAWSTAKLRAKWLDDKSVKIRTSTRPKSIRLEQDGSIIAVWFTRKGPAKSVVSVDEDKLPSKEAADAVKQYWGEKLDDLKATLFSG
jgi:hypothetical protein